MDHTPRKHLIGFLCRVNHAELTIVFAAPDHIPFLLTIAPKLRTLKVIVSLESLEDDQKRVLSAWAKTVGVAFKDITESMPRIPWGTILVTDRSVQLKSSDATI